MRILAIGAVALIGALSVAGAWAKRVPEPPLARQDQPYVSWQLRAEPGTYIVNISLTEQIASGDQPVHEQIRVRVQ